MKRTLSYDGETRTLCEWAKRMGISHQVLRYRLDAGWTPGSRVKHAFTAARLATPI